MNALNKAIKQANGVTALARMLGCSENLPTMWKRRGRVPLEWCPAIERATGVTCEALRPDWEWAYVRSRKANGKKV